MSSIDERFVFYWWWFDLDFTYESLLIYYKLRRGGVSPLPPNGEWMKPVAGYIIAFDIRSYEFIPLPRDNYAVTCGIPSDRTGGAPPPGSHGIGLGTDQMPTRHDQWWRGNELFENNQPNRRMSVLSLTHWMQEEHHSRCSDVWTLGILGSGFGKNNKRIV